MASNNSISKRIDKELADLIKEVSTRNDISERRAAKTIARSFRKSKGRNILDEIRF